VVLGVQGLPLPLAEKKKYQHAKAADYTSNASLVTGERGGNVMNLPSDSLKILPALYNDKYSLTQSHLTGACW
jgi:hypothetical protein